MLKNNNKTQQHNNKTQQHNNKTQRYYSLHNQYSLIIKVSDVKTEHYLGKFQNRRPRMIWLKDTSTSSGLFLIEMLQTQKGDTEKHEEESTAL